MSYLPLQQQIYENKVRRNFNITNIGSEIILMTEELGELSEAITLDNPVDFHADMVDALGDLMVYGLGLSAMFNWNADEIINYQVEPHLEISDYHLSLSNDLGKFAKTFKKSNKKIVQEVDRRDDFKTYLGNLLGNCHSALNFLGEQGETVLENIVKNNTIRTHQGRM